MPESEPHDVRLRRLHMRSSRRGTKEMDIILQRFAQARLSDMNPAALDRYEALLNENDQDLYAWITGQGDAPPEHAALIAEIRGLIAVN